MKETAQRWKLSTGIEVNYVENGNRQLSSALVRVNVGSMHEPSHWLGIAHLTEHMLFAGGQRFQGRQRLLPWIQQQGGQVNATTGMTSTCFYFQSQPEHLISGVLRLLDMLLSPRLDPRDLQREVEVIDAEYQLRCHDNRSLIEALVRSQIVEPKEMARFCMGNADTLGADLHQLSSALHEYYLQGYRPENLQLWLCCARPFGELRQLMQISNEPLLKISAIQESNASDKLEINPNVQVATRSGYIGIGCQKSILLSYFITDKQQNLSRYWELFTQILEDQAPHALVWLLTAEEKRGALSTQLISHSPNHLLFSILYQGANLTENSVLALMQTLRQWFKLASTLTERELLHYQQQSVQQQRQQPLMHQLRNIALNLSVLDLDGIAKGWQRLLAQLSATEPCSYYLLDPAIKTPVSSCFAGLGIDFIPSQFPNRGCSLIAVKPSFYPKPLPTMKVLANPPPASLFFDNTPICEVQIILRPAVGMILTKAQRLHLLSALAPLFSLLSHYGGYGKWITQHGTDLICLTANDKSVLSVFLAELENNWLASVGLDEKVESQAAILIKSMLSQFPTLFSQRNDSYWTASIAGVSEALSQPLLRQLGELPVQWITSATSVFEPKRMICRHETQSSGENALIAFIPFTGTQGSVEAATLLSSCYEPAFYQWLREELAIGYVVSCRYQNFCDRQGILFLLQSPKLNCQMLRRYCQLFVDKMRSELLSTELAMPVELPVRDELEAHIERLQQRCLLNPFLPIEEMSLAQQVRALHEEVVEQVKAGAGFWYTSGETSASPVSGIIDY